MAKTIASSDIAEGAPFHVQLRAREFQEKTSQKGSTFWRINAGLPKSNPKHEGEYDPEFVTFLIWHPSLRSALEQQITKQAPAKDKEREVWNLTIFRSKDSWVVSAGYVQEPGGQAAAPAGGRSAYGAPPREPLPSGSGLAFLRGLGLAYVFLDRALADAKLHVQPSADAIERMAVSWMIFCGDHGLDAVKELQGNMPQTNQGKPAGPPPQPAPRPQPAMRPAQTAGAMPREEPPPPDEEYIDPDDELPF